MTTLDPGYRHEVDSDSTISLEVELLQAREAIDQLTHKVTHLETALRTNRRIGIAVGIVMTELALDDAAAFEAMVGVSQRFNRKVADIAEDVIYRGRLS